MEENYIAILIQSLEKKISVLEEISRENKRQREVLQEADLDPDAFQATADRKEQLIEQVGFLDDGFEKMYARVKDALQEEKQAYKQEITQLKELIVKVTELTMTVQKEEWDNRNLAEQQFSNSKKKVRQMKDTKRVARQYYKNMAKLNYVDPQFMDNKK